MVRIDRIIRIPNISAIVGTRTRLSVCIVLIIRLNIIRIQNRSRMIILCSSY